MEFDTREEAYRHLHANQMVGQADKDIESAKRILSVFKTKCGGLGSVLDVGCGRGAWMYASAQLGAPSVVGVEGPWANLKDMIAFGDYVRTVDLATGKFDLGQDYDTVICIEVAEHLAPEVADDFVASLAKHGDRIIFSAAIPGQGGHGHINEQHLDYWQTKFAKHGFGRRDIFRKKLWDDTAIHYYLRQNVVLFERWAENDEMPASVVHPEMWDTISGRYGQVMDTLVKAGWVEQGTSNDGLLEITIRVPERAA